VTGLRKSPELPYRPTYPAAIPGHRRIAVVGSTSAHLRFCMPTPSDNFGLSATKKPALGTAPNHKKRRERLHSCIGPVAGRAGAALDIMRVAGAEPITFEIIAGMERVVGEEWPHLSEEDWDSLDDWDESDDDESDEWDDLDDDWDDPDDEFDDLDDDWDE